MRRVLVPLTALSLFGLALGCRHPQNACDCARAPAPASGATDLGYGPASAPPAYATPVPLTPGGPRLEQIPSMPPPETGPPPAKAVQRNPLY